MSICRPFPFAGPEHPFTSDGKAIGAKNHRSGHVEDAHLNHYNFDDQYNTFHRCRPLSPPAPGAHRPGPETYQHASVHGMKKAAY